LGLLAGLPPTLDFPAPDSQSFDINNRAKFESLGRAWLGLVEQTVRAGRPMGTEGLELLGVSVSFPASGDGDAVLEQYGDRRMMAEMRKVFFEEGSNALGHTYAAGMRGPGGRNDLQDVVALLSAEPASKRAVVTFCGQGDGQVPCVNVVQFLVREGAVQGMYFARGQDVFRKFYADALCLARMAQVVAAGLGLPAGRMTGFIGSGHVYHQDLPAIRELLAKAGMPARPGGPKGGGG
jgi:hypothetical protein